MVRSPATGQAYPLRWICAALRVPRSSVYAAQRPRTAASGHRGPVPALSDAALLTAVREDLAASPFTGEGHRKVRARLRRRAVPIRVSRERVRRVMGQAHLLAPYRVRRTHGHPAHDGTVITGGPNQRWGTDGTTVMTAQEGRVWLFLTVEHWNSELLGWHVTTRGDRFAALAAVQGAVHTVAGHLEPDAVRGVELRMDHGSQYTARDFRAGIRFWGLSASYAFVGEPEGNGVAERMIGILKEQVLAGRVFQDAAEVRAAVAVFIPCYNADWLLARHGYRSPHEVRRALATQVAA